MGAFLVRMDGQAKPIVLRNTLHYDGTEHILRRVFTNVFAYTFYMGISARGRNLEEGDYGPQGGVEHDLGEEVRGDRVAWETSEGGGHVCNSGGGAHVNESEALAHPGLADEYRNNFRYKTGITEEEVSFFVENQGSALIRSSEVAFHNDINWSPTHEDCWKTRDPPVASPNKCVGDKEWWPNHGYPWCQPRVDFRCGPGPSLAGDPTDWSTFNGVWRVQGTVGESWAGAAAQNLWRACAFAVNSIYIIAYSGTAEWLIVSACFAGPVIIRPGGTLYGKWIGRIAPG